MKKYYFLFSLLLLAFSSIGQFNVYHPFPDSNAYWNILTEWYDPSACLHGTSYNIFDYYLKGDTVINGNKYHKLRFSGGLEGCGAGPAELPYYDQDYSKGFLREDSAKHIYYKPTATSRDTLLYDFNLNVGNLLPNTYNNNKMDSNIVSRIDSVLIGKTYRKQYVIFKRSAPIQEYDSIIEGIGSCLGLLERIIPPFEYVTSLSCFSQNGKTLYPDTNSSCQFFTLGIPGIAQPKNILSTYPNPASNEVTIKYKLPSSSSKACLNLYNSLGQPIKSRYLESPEGIINENLFDLPNGVYYYILSDATGIVTANKLVIIH